LTIPYAITTGVFGGWGAVLYPNLKSFNFSENSAGWLGSISTLSGCVGGVIVGILANRFSGKMKTIIIINFIISGIAFLWFCFFVFRYISSNTISIFTVGIIAGTCIITPTPLFFELTMETIHPDIPEGSATSFLSFMATLVQVIFVGLSFLPTQDVSQPWMNWLMMSCVPFSVIILLFWKAKYSRFEHDTLKVLQVSVIDSFGIM